MPGYEKTTSVSSEPPSTKPSAMPNPVTFGSSAVLEEMWPLARRLLDGSLVSSLAEVAEAIRTLAERQRVIAEGAGAAPVAAALAGKAPGRKTVCVVSGGNIDFEKLAKIFKREL